MKNRLSVIVLIGLAIALVAGLAELFTLRLESGDVYPAYSSLRADPLGAMALCESLERMSGVTVRRDYSASGQLPDGHGITYMHLGAKVYEWMELPEDEFKQIGGFVSAGGRLVITLFPETSRFALGFGAGWRRAVAGTTNSPSARRSSSPQPKNNRMKPANEGEPMISLKDRWGLDFGYLGFTTLGAGNLVAELDADRRDLSIPDALEWHSAVVFTNLNTLWQTIYARGTNPVVIERQFGRGTIVMSTDSYYLSNEAMLKDRHPDLLAWLVGPNHRVVFDEAHFGIIENGGVAALIRKYRLHGLVAGLLVLAGLFIWRNSVSFVPPSIEPEKDEYVAGEEAAAGLINLLRRNVAAKDLLTICFREWTNSLGLGRTCMIRRVDQATAAMEAEGARPLSARDPAGTYRLISQILQPGRAAGVPATMERGPATTAKEH